LAFRLNIVITMILIKEWYKNNNFPYVDV